MKRVYLLANPKESLRFTVYGDSVSIQLPTKAIDPIATVVVADTK